MPTTFDESNRQLHIRAWLVGSFRSQNAVTFAVDALPSAFASTCGVSTPSFAIRNQPAVLMNWNAAAWVFPPLLISA